MINQQIRDREVRVIDQNGQQLGIMSSRQALELAEQRQLDLVKIAPHAKPPVCKIMDYGKYRFEAAKREKEARKNQKVINVKEIRLSVTIEEHDLNVKAKNAVKFLKAGDKVKVSIRFRGRQMSYVDNGMNVMNSFVDLVKDYATIEKKPKLEGRNMTMILSPKE
ncbi:MAG: translation initiation factor IF-3 [Clostridia bacterium]|jgi:translation initiation factor IF-3